MNVPVRMGSRVLAGALLVALAFVVFGSDRVGAQSPTTPPITRTGWEMNTPAEIVATPGFMGEHGDPALYEFALAIPAPSDPGWEPTPNVASVNHMGVSRVPSCQEYADFTYFQTFIGVPAGAAFTTFTVDIDAIDDGARVTVFNSANPNGIVAPGGFVMLGGFVSVDLATLLVRGERNRVVITQVDDCPGDTYLGSAIFFVDGVRLEPNG